MKKTVKKIKFNIRKTINIALTLIMVIGGIFWSIKDSIFNQVIDNRVYYGIVHFKTSFGVLFFWLTITFILTLGFMLMSKYVNNLIEKKKTEEISQESKDQVIVNKQKFERNVSACEYRKWSK